MTILVRDTLRQIDVCRHILPIKVTQVGSKHGDWLVLISFLASELNVMSAVLEVLASPFK